MQEKDLIQKLNNLKTIKPAEEWKNTQRDILFAQISGTQSERKIGWSEIFENLLPKQLAVATSTPVWLSALIIIIVLGGGLLSVRAANQSKPGDSLYIAKMISEKTQLALTFNDKDKAKLNLEFAGNRAKEISQVIGAAQKEKNADDNTIEQLTNSFNNEISAAKNRLAKIDQKINDNLNNIGNADDSDQKVQVFGANLEKTDEGVQISGGDTGIAADNATSSQENTVAQPDSLSVALSEAQKLFNSKDYTGTIDKIGEAQKIIDNPADNTTGTATTTDTSTGTSTDSKTGAATSTK